MRPKLGFQIAKKAGEMMSIQYEVMLAINMCCAFTMGICIGLLAGGGPLLSPRKRGAIVAVIVCADGLFQGSNS